VNVSGCTFYITLQKNRSILPHCSAARWRKRWSGLDRGLFIDLPSLGGILAQSLR
jgi:hypothetical protein